ncbi:MAG: DUF5661 family protein [Nitrospirota bacterium]
MNRPKQFSLEDARRIGDSLGINWRHADLKQFRLGLAMELEYVTVAPETCVTSSDESMAGKIALAHLKEFPSYYARLATMEADAEKRHGAKLEYAV